MSIDNKFMRIHGDWSTRKLSTISVTFRSIVNSGKSKDKLVELHLEMIFSTKQYNKGS